MSELTHTLIFSSNGERYSFPVTDEEAADLGSNIIYADSLSKPIWTLFTRALSGKDDLSDVVMHKGTFTDEEKMEL